MSGCVPSGKPGWTISAPAEPGRPAQEHSFREHIRIAREHSKALQIHDRDAHLDVVRVLKDEELPERVVFHCFSGDAELAEICNENGWYLSFSGTVTFKNSHRPARGIVGGQPRIGAGGDRCAVPHPAPLPGAAQRQLPDPADRAFHGRNHWVSTSRNIAGRWPQTPERVYGAF